ncbi:hypothetical protein HMPREF1624_08525 [Sporothrix schenckii ATCC 58251]|uniref:Uncharacterized protein n=1 Tax=Sporothrix schenckii (strain ATCC 58251 / de Perez 2211183) TaxID=1391915 RepID=U7PJE7_SPOS1|nr:hypothetical protein HMPREF1624_08525 [Sporothrix schenckii ATCC 58251]
MIGSIQAIVADHSANITKIDSVVLKPINDFMTMEKPQLMEKLEKQEIALGKLRTEMLAIESGLKTSPPADGQSQGQHDKVHGTGSKTAPVPAPTASNAGTPPTTTPLAFPGDDFTSLRIEISRLNERIGPLEKIPETVENIQSRQAKAVALNSIERNKLRDELRKEVRTGWDNLAVTFGDLIDKETKERSMDSERLKELERTLRDLKELPGSTTDNARIASTTANTDVDMAETTLEPFLSPVPEPVSTVGPAEPIEPMEQLTAMPPAVTRVSNTGPATKSSQPGSNPDVRDLEKEMRLLQQRMQYSEDDVRAVRVEFDGQCATLRMMVSTLDSQFNNLTTKDLFHAIIGHLEKMYPNARQLQEDVKRIGLDVNLIKQNNRITDETIQKLEDIIAAPVGQKRLLAGRADNGGHVGESSSMIKRQKTSGTTPNGNASTNSPTNRPVNGAAVASASASS